MKNIVKLALIFLLLTSLLSGCASSATTKENTNRLQEIQDRGYIEVVTEPAFAPFEFIDPSKDGDEKYIGADIELAKYIADKLEVELRIIPLEFGAVLSSISEGKYDLAISALAYTPARAQAMNMSKGYYFSEDSPGYGLLIRGEDEEIIRGPEDVKDKVMVAQSGSLQEVFVNEQITQYKDFKRVSATTDGFLMVQENKADVCAVSISMAQLYINANPNADLKIIEDFNFIVDPKTDGTRVGMPLGEDELEEEINMIIDQVLNDGSFEKWHKEYTKYAESLGL